MKPADKIRAKYKLNTAPAAPPTAPPAKAADQIRAKYSLGATSVPDIGPGSVRALEVAQQEAAKETPTETSVPAATRRLLRSELRMGDPAPPPPATMPDLPDNLRAGVPKGTLLDEAVYLQTQADPAVSGRNLVAGFGDVAKSAGSAAKWAGAEGVGKALSEQGEKLQKANRGVEGPEWKDLSTPGDYVDYIRTKGVKSLAFPLAVAPIGIAGAAAGTAAAGALGLGAVGTALTAGAVSGLASRPVEAAMEAGGTYEEALGRGMTDEQARTAARGVFYKNLGLAGADAAQMAAALAPVPQWLKVVLGIPLGALSEAAEEGVQEVFQRQALGDEIKWDDAMKESTFLGGWMGLGFGAGGAMVDTRKGGAPTVDPQREALLKRARNLADGYVEREGGIDQAIAKVQAVLPNVKQGGNAETAAVLERALTDLQSRERPAPVAETPKSTLTPGAKATVGGDSYTLVEQLPDGKWVLEETTEEGTTSSREVTDVLAQRLFARAETKVEPTAKRPEANRIPPRTEVLFGKDGKLGRIDNATGPNAIVEDRDGLLWEVPYDQITFAPQKPQTDGLTTSLQRQTQITPQAQKRARWLKQTAPWLSRQDLFHLATQFPEMADAEYEAQMQDMLPPTPQTAQPQAEQPAAEPAVQPAPEAPKTARQPMTSNERFSQAQKLQGRVKLVREAAPQLSAQDAAYLANQTSDMDDAAFERTLRDTFAEPAKTYTHSPGERVRDSAGRMHTVLKDDGGPQVEVMTPQGRQWVKRDILAPDFKAGESVSFNGQQYTVVGVEGDKLHLTSKDSGADVWSKMEGIWRNPDGSLEWRAVPKSATPATPVPQAEPVKAETSAEQPTPVVQAKSAKQDKPAPAKVEPTSAPTAPPGGWQMQKQGTKTTLTPAEADALIAQLKAQGREAISLPHPKNTKTRQVFAAPQKATAPDLTPDLTRAGFKDEASARDTVAKAMQGDATAKKLASELTDATITALGGDPAAVRKADPVKETSKKTEPVKKPTPATVADFVAKNDINIGDTISYEYTAGSRKGERVNVTVEDIDAVAIRVKDAKGNILPLKVMENTAMAATIRKEGGEQGKSNAASEGDAKVNSKTEADRIMELLGFGDVVDSTNKRETTDKTPEELAVERKRREEKLFQEGLENVAKERERFNKEGWRTFVDEGPSGYDAGKRSITRTDKGFADPNMLAKVPGAEGEEALFTKNATGRMDTKEWGDLIASVKEHGVVHAVLVTKEKDGTVHVAEGNHRIRLAIAAGVKDIPVEFRYFGNSQRDGLAWDTATNQPGPALPGSNPVKAPTTPSTPPTQPETAPLTDTGGGDNKASGNAEGQGKQPTPAEEVIDAYFALRGDGADPNDRQMWAHLIELADPDVKPLLEAVRKLPAGHYRENALKWLAGVTELDRADADRSTREWNLDTDDRNLYREILSTGSKGSLKKGETWRDRVIRYAKGAIEKGTGGSSGEPTADNQKRKTPLQQLIEEEEGKGEEAPPPQGEQSPPIGEGDVNNPSVRESLREKVKASEGEGIAEEGGAAQVGLLTGKPQTSQPAPTPAKGGKPNVDVPLASPEIEKRFQSAGSNQPRDSVLKRIQEWGTEVWLAMTRDLVHLERGAKWAELRKKIHTLTKGRGIASDSATRYLRGITVELNKEANGQYDLFKKAIILSDLKEDLDRGLYANVPIEELPFGYTPDQLNSDHARVMAAAQADPQVKRALEDRAAALKEVVDEYSEAYQAVNHKEPPFDRKNYFRHEVLAMMSAEDSHIEGGGKGLAAPNSASYLKGRKGSALDYSTNYLEVEHKILASLMYHTKKYQLWQYVRDTYDITAQVKAKAKGEGDGKGWRKYVPEGYRTIQPQEGSTFYEAYALHPRLVDEIFNNGLGELVGPVYADELRKVLVKGGQKEALIVPNEVAATIEEFGKPKYAGRFASLDRGMRYVVGKWKQWQINSPTRILKQHLRNISGDADSVVAGNPTTVLKLKQATADLYEFYHRGTASPDLDAWLERGGLHDTMGVAENIGDIHGLRLFQNLLDKKQTILGDVKSGRLDKVAAKLWNGYWSAAELSNEMREALLRYAAFLDYKAQIQENGGKPKNYGASIREEIGAMRNIDDKAHQLSNDLLGAYDEITVFGQWLRDKFYPFWSWNEVNTKRYKRLIQNAALDGNTTQTVGKMAARKLVGTVVQSPIIAYRVGKFALKASAFSAMLAAWNNLFFREEEKELPKEARSRPHIIFGRDVKGNVLYFNRLGAFSDFLDWFGLGESHALTVEFLNGEKSLKEVVETLTERPRETVARYRQGLASKTNVAVSLAYAPANKLVQGLGPTKTVAEAALGKKSYPDFTKPTAIRDSWEYLADSVGVGGAYRRAAGKPTRQLGRDLTGLVIYEVDPKEVAYNEFLSQKYKWLEQTKGSSDRSEYSARANALYYLKKAIRYDDQEAMKKYMAEFDKLGGSKANMKASIERMHPLGGLSKADTKAFKETLSVRELTQLEQAEKYYDEVLAAEDYKELPEYQDMKRK